MGFKRGWQAFRAASKSRTASRPVVAKMARRKARTSGRFARKARRGRSSGGSVKLLQPSAMVYGAGRGYVLNAAAPLLAKLPVPAGTHGVVGGALLSYGLAKYGSGFLKQVGMDGLKVENAAAGAFIGSMALGGIPTTNGNGVTNSPYL
jgi:hypothetical protein